MQLKTISISKVVPNPDNPRNIDIATEDDKLSYLVDSIRQFGVLVPIVVTPRGAGFFLVDGERRFHAAKAAGLDRLPAFVLEKEGGGDLTDADLLYRMFQIHHLREQWGPIQQCFALEKTYQQICQRKAISPMTDDARKFTAVVNALKERTGIDTRTASDRVKFLRWPDELKKKLYSHPTPGAYSYILEIEDKIIIPALSNYPEYFEKVPVDEIRTDLFLKLNASLANAQEVRQVAPYFRTTLTKPADRKRLTQVLSRLARNVHMTYEDAHEELAHQFPDILPNEPPSPQRLLTMIRKLENCLEQFDTNSFGSATRRAKADPADLLQSAESLRQSLQEIIDEISEHVS